MMNSKSLILSLLLTAGISSGGFAENPAHNQRSSGKVSDLTARFEQQGAGLPRGKPPGPPPRDTSSKPTPPPRNPSPKPTPPPRNLSSSGGSTSQASPPTQVRPSSDPTPVRRPDRSKRNAMYMPGDTDNKRQAVDYGSSPVKTGSESVPQGVEKMPAAQRPALQRHAATMISPDAALEGFIEKTFVKETGQKYREAKPPYISEKDAMTNFFVHLTYDLRKKCLQGVELIDQGLQSAMAANSEDMKKPRYSQEVLTNLTAIKSQLRKTKRDFTLSGWKKFQAASSSEEEKVKNLIKGYDELALMGKNCKNQSEAAIYTSDIRLPNLNAYPEKK